MTRKLCLATGRGYAGDVRFLKGIGADEVGGHLASKSDDGNGVHVGVGYAGHQVGGSRPDVVTHTDLAGGPSVSFRGMDGSLFVPGKNIAYVRIIEGVEYGQDHASGDAEDDLDPPRPPGSSPPPWHR